MLRRMTLSKDEFAPEINEILEDLPWLDLELIMDLQILQKIKPFNDPPLIEHMRTHK
jgi:hypothetical protein